MGSSCAHTPPSPRGGVVGEMKSPSRESHAQVQKGDGILAKKENGRGGLGNSWKDGKFAYK